MSFREFLGQSDNGSVSPDREALKAAAFRLKHDLGKAIRWSAPAVRETDPDSLRRRLARDLLETRVGPDGRARTAVEIYEVWLVQEGALFSTAPGASARLVRMSESIEAIRRRLARLSELGWEDLVALDEACRVVSDESRALWREAAAAASDGSPP